MNPRTLVLTATIGAALFAPCQHAFAQASRTWVSGVGDDANPGSRVSPCKTFAGAISKTAPGGEISVLDPGGFGALTITKATTIEGQGTLASVLVAGTNGIVVAAGPSDTVILRNLTLNGYGSGLSGIKFISGGALIIEDCRIFGFTVNDIDVALTASGHIHVLNTNLNGGAIGVSVTTTTGTVTASLRNVTITNTSHAGVYAGSGVTEISNSDISQNTLYGLDAEGTGIINSDTNSITLNNCGTYCTHGAGIRLTNTSLFDNKTGVGAGGGVIVSGSNNHESGNSGGSIPTGTPGFTFGTF